MQARFDRAPAAPIRCRIPLAPHKAQPCPADLGDAPGSAVGGERSAVSPRPPSRPARQPDHARAHVRDYASITPGRYLGKRHWISLGPGAGITERLVTDAVEDSYGLVAERLPPTRPPQRSMSAANFPANG